jgi:hypothetical protein
VGFVLESVNEYLEIRSLGMPPFSVVLINWKYSIEQRKLFEDARFQIIRAEESYRPM